MSETTKIQWAQHTGGPWLGCSCVSAGCTFCYAMLLALGRLLKIFREAYRKAGFDDWETRPIWGDKATRVLTKGFWDDARRLNAQHAKNGTRGRWFPSMIDWLDEMPGGIIDQEGNKLDPTAVLADFAKLIHDTPNLDWLLLTKRPENWRRRLLNAIPDFQRHEHKDYTWIEDWLNGGRIPSNIWIGTSIEDQPREKRVSDVLKIPAKIRFLSCEPLLDWLDLSDPLCLETDRDGSWRPRSKFGEEPLIHWVIVGGESGPKARPCNIEWIRSLVHQCKAAGVPVFVKQLGSKPMQVVANQFHVSSKPFTLRDQKGGDMEEWPMDLRVREFPV